MDEAEIGIAGSSKSSEVPSKSMSILRKQLRSLKLACTKSTHVVLHLLDCHTRSLSFRFAVPSNTSNRFGANFCSAVRKVVRTLQKSLCDGFR